ncbi:SGNH/GDSL hydrolase family protein [Algibacter agarivorans]|uniref:SGNH/GDSL hydrolase family protein n=1 Tax=Algibacter agarivorans TaxID=1109741 RepID=A0ABP9GNG6_9FLAO
MKPTKHNFILFSWGILVLLLCCKKTHKFATTPLDVNYSNHEITYSGRIDSSNQESVKLYWPGSSISLNFEGQSINALLKDSKGDSYYNVILDNDSIFILRPDTLKSYHTLAQNLKKGKHTIEIFKRTEPHYGVTNFYSFKIEGDGKILEKSPKKKRKIEFYGNSITSGYAVEDMSGADSPDGTYTNNYLSYSAITARYFDAEYRAICKTGIGIMVSWHNIIMPEMYDRLNPHDPHTKWDFSLYQPDVAVVNLFQNDSWLFRLPENENFKKRFGEKAPSENNIINAYKDFVSKIRAHYPNADIICILGNMDVTKKDSKWPRYVETAVSQLKDPKIFTYFAPYKNTGNHPSIKEQQAIADGLIDFIEQKIDW